MVSIDESTLKHYEKGVRALHAGKWKDAEKAFSTVLETSDRSDLTLSAHQYLDIARARQAEAGEEAEGDPFLAAVVARNRGELAEALALCRQGRRAAKDERFAYLEAAILALQGESAAAVTALQRAIDLNPANLVHAYHDTDFDAVRSHPEISSIFARAEA